MEFGPRSLGAVLLLTLVRQNAKQLNIKVKYRESFRPFAPSVLVNMLVNGLSMILMVLTCLLWLTLIKKAYEMKEEEKALFIDKQHYVHIPAITHVVYSARSNGT